MNKTDSVISLAETITKSECQLDNGYIAPGTEGNFFIIVNGEGSKVNIEYEVKIIREENTPSNLYFFLNNAEEKYNTLTELFNKNDFSGSFEISGEKFKEYEIFWKWPYENQNQDGTIDENKDIEDLNFAQKQKDYIFEIEISGKQSIK